MQNYTSKATDHAITNMRMLGDTFSPIHDILNPTQVPNVTLSFRFLKKKVNAELKKISL